MAARDVLFSSENRIPYIFAWALVEFFSWFDHAGARTVSSAWILRGSTSCSGKGPPRDQILSAVTTAVTNCGCSPSGKIIYEPIVAGSLVRVEVDSAVDCVSPSTLHGCHQLHCRASFYDGSADGDFCSRLSKLWRRVYGICRAYLCVHQLTRHYK